LATLERGSMLAAALGQCSAPLFDLACFDEHYVLRRHVLGNGASGDVRTAVCRKTGNVVAVKSFKKAGLCAERLATLRAELELHASVRHPGIAEVIAVYDAEEAAHMVLELLQGGELFDRVLRAKQIQDSRASEVTRQLLQALAYLHERGIMHRDIKMENILFDRCDSWSVKLIDFGFATRVHTGQALVHRCGTLLYAAPEVVGGIPYDEKADLWSMGAVAYAMLTGEMLYSGQEVETFRKARRGQVEFGLPFDRLSPEAQSFLCMLLRANPAERPSARQALRHPWLQTDAWGMAWLEKAFSEAVGVQELLRKATDVLGTGWLPEASCEVSRKSEH